MKEQILTEQVEQLKAAIRQFIKACPNFENGNELAGNIGRALANVESTLYHEFGCWELETPRL